MVPPLSGLIVSALRLRVVIPHFFREGASESSGGYGSGRRGNRLPRSLARSLFGQRFGAESFPRDGSSTSLNGRWSSAQSVLVLPP